MSRTALERIDSPNYSVEHIVTTNQANPIIETMKLVSEQNHRTSNKVTGQWVSAETYNVFVSHWKKPLPPTLTGGDKELDRVSAISDRSDRLGGKSGREGLLVHITAFARAHYLRQVQQNEGSGRVRLTTPKLVRSNPGL